MPHAGLRLHLRGDLPTTRTPSGWLRAASIPTIPSPAQRVPAKMPLRGSPAHSGSAYRPPSSSNSSAMKARRFSMTKLSSDWKASADARWRSIFPSSAPRPNCSMRDRGLLSATQRSGEFIEAHAGEMNPVVRGIIEGGAPLLRGRCIRRRVPASRIAPRDGSPVGAAWTFWCCPQPAPSTRTMRLPPNPCELNTNLGYYTNFVNLLDLAAVAVPAGRRANGLPFGISFIGRAFSDEALLALAERVHRARRTRLPPADTCPAGLRRARRGWRAPLRTAAELAANRPRRTADRRPAGPRRVTDSTRSKGRCRPNPVWSAISDFAGPGIEVEVWAMPEDRFGGFVGGGAGASRYRQRSPGRRPDGEVFHLRALRRRRSRGNHPLRRLAQLSFASGITKIDRADKQDFAVVRDRPGDRIRQYLQGPRRH